MNDTTITQYFRPLRFEIEEEEARSFAGEGFSFDAGRHYPDSEEGWQLYLAEVRRMFCNVEYWVENGCLAEEFPAASPPLPLN
jgi:hypothetical protein